MISPQQATPQTSQPVPTGSAPAASAATSPFVPTAQPGYFIQQIDFLGIKHSPWTNKDTGKKNDSVKIHSFLGVEDTEFSSFLGRMATIYETTMDVFKKMQRVGLNPTKYSIPLWVEMKLVSKKEGQKIVIVDVHFSPYQLELLVKGEQPLTIDRPLIN